MSGPFGSSQWMYKSGEVIAWGGTRMISGGGTTGNGGTAAGNAATIDYVNIAGANANALTLVIYQQLEFHLVQYRLQEEWSFLVVIHRIQMLWNMLLRRVLVMLLTLAIWLLVLHLIK